MPAAEHFVIALWPWPLTFWSRGQYMPRSCHRVGNVCTKFGVDSSSRFSFKARTQIHCASAIRSAWVIRTNMGQRRGGRSRWINEWSANQSSTGLFHVENGGRPMARVSYSMYGADVLCPGRTHARTPSRRLRLIMAASSRLRKRGNWCDVTEYDHHDNGVINDAILYLSRGSVKRRVVNTR